MSRVRLVALSAAVTVFLVWLVPESAAVPPSLHHLTMSVTTPVTAGAPFTLTARAYDASNKLITTYNAAVTFTDLSGSLSGEPAHFTNGIAKSTTAEIASAYHDDRITVTSGAKTLRSAQFNVFGALHHLTLTVKPPVFTATSFTMTAKAYDAAGTLLTGYHSAVSFSDLSGSLSGTPSAFARGVAHTTTAEVGDAYRADRITVSSGAKNAQSAAFNVMGPLDHLAVLVTGPVTAGGTFALAARAYDSANNLLSGYNGAVSWGDLSSTLTSTPSSFSSGVAKTTTASIADPYHSDKITATSGAKSGQSSAFDVLGPLDHFSVSRPRQLGALVATSTFTVTSKALDEAGNFLNGYSGSATWADSSGTIDPPTPSSFANGVSTTTGVSIGSAWPGDMITVDSGGKQGTSEPFESTGAVLLKDILGGPGDSNFEPPIAIGGTLYFSANDGAHGYELWKSNGTPAGTVLVKDINPGLADSLPGPFVDVDGTLYFSADDGTNGYELWKSDGTLGGTVLVKDINPTGDSEPDNFANVGGTLFFDADDGTHSFELWKSNGTEAGTVLVKDINPTGCSCIDEMTDLGGTAIFTATDGTSTGHELWRSNGTEAGTTLVADINTTGTEDSDPFDLTVMGGFVYFAADDGTNGDELWRSDGTGVETTLVADIDPSGSSSPIDFTVMGGNLYFDADDGTDGAELWRSNGTGLGTSLVTDINPTGDADPLFFAVLNGELYFGADDGVTNHGIELWKTNGTAPGTVLVKDINPTGDALTSFMTTVNGKVYFNADDGTNGFELWRSGGTEAGTILVKNIDSCGCGSLPHYLTDVGGKLLFFADDGFHGFELFRG